MRDRFVFSVCNWLLNHIATKRYRKFILVVAALGIEQLEIEKAQRARP